MTALPPGRIVLAECLHEICSFNPVPTRYDDFYIHPGERLLDYHRPIGSEVSGALGVFAQHEHLQVIPAYSARGITSGGTIPSEDFRRLAREFLDAIRAAGPVDGAYLALHGAMAAVGEDDPEGYLLTETRRIVGKQTSIVASFDLHGVLTDRILEMADAIVVYHTYPHVDFVQTGERAARLLVRLIEDRRRPSDSRSVPPLRPVTAKVEIPALVRGDELMTETGLFGAIVQEARQIEASPGGVSAGLFIGNPFTDVPELRSYSVVTTDGDAARAEREAVRLAELFWPQRSRMQARLNSLEASVQQAIETAGPVALVDAADATSSGASGDSNAILRQLVLAGYRGRALVPIVDPAAVAEAFRVGVGASISTTVGGALDRRRFEPLPIAARVTMLSDGHFRSESFQQAWHSGPTAVLAMDRITLVATSRPVHLFDRSLFLAHGQDPRQFDLIVVKSPHCQRHMYADWCTLIHVDAPGSTSANLPSLGHTRCRRPVYPLDDNFAWTPQAKLFERSE